MPGSCYGGVGPLEKKPASEELYLHDFPELTIRDMVHMYQVLRQYLGIGKIYMGIGGSMGGQQLLEWAIEEPGTFEHIVPIATNAWHSALEERRSMHRSAGPSRAIPPGATNFPRPACRA